MNYLREMDSRDIERSFQGGCIFLNQPEISPHIHPFKISSWDMGSSTLHGYRFLEDGTSQEVRVGMYGDHIDLSIPEFGAVHHNRPYYVTRKEDKQYHRAARKVLCNFYRITENGLQRDSVQDNVFYRMMFKFVNGDRGTGVLDRDFQIYKQVLYFRGLPVGTVSGRVISTQLEDLSSIFNHDYEVVYEPKT